MTVVILAAGQGLRLGNLTENKPKCLIELDGKSILDYQLDLFKKIDIKNVLIVTGYKHEKILVKNVTKIYNKKYKTTNMVKSLFCAEKYFDDDLIISYGDIIYSKTVLNKLIAANNAVSVIVDTLWKDLWSIRMENSINDIETMKIRNNKIINLGKKVKNTHDVEGQYIGLIKIKTKFLKSLVQFYHSLNTLIKYDGNSFDNMYMTTLLQLIINNYNNVTPVFINGGWLEIDTVSDLKAYEKYKYIQNVV